jgi:hypothetical protein
LQRVFRKDTKERKMPAQMLYCMYVSFVVFLYGKNNFFLHKTGGFETREEVFMEGPLEPNMGPSLADVLL